MSKKNTDKGRLGAEEIKEGYNPPPPRDERPDPPPLPPPKLNKEKAES